MNDNYLQRELEGTAVWKQFDQSYQPTTKY